MDPLATFSLALDVIRVPTSSIISLQIEPYQKRLEGYRKILDNPDFGESVVRVVTRSASSLSRMASSLRRYAGEEPLHRLSWWTLPSI